MVFRVYVIELNNRVKKSPKFLGDNFDMDHDLECFYVGYTSHTPERRFRKHKEGGRTSNYFVRKFGVKLRPDIYNEYNNIYTREEAEEIEEELAELLKDEGHGVWCGLGTPQFE